MNEIAIFGRFNSKVSCTAIKKVLHHKNVSGGATWPTWLSIDSRFLQIRPITQLQGRLVTNLLSHYKIQYN